MVMRRKRLKTPKNMNLQNTQLFLSQIQNQNITVKKYGCMNSFKYPCAFSSLKKTDF
jgi:hypothetical protein